MEIIGGAIIPLSFFPQMLQGLFFLLPFPFLIYFPMNIFLRKISNSQIFMEFLKEIGWIVGLLVLNLIIWKKGVKRYVAMRD